MFDYLARHGIVRAAITRGGDAVPYRWDGATHALPSDDPGPALRYTAQVAALSVESFGTRAWLRDDVPQARTP